MATSLAAFYAGAKVCHVEAGLRTHTIYSPFPEEVNRQVTGHIATYHFAPTVQAKQNLLAENVAAETIVVIGNTVIDALLTSSARVQTISNEEIDHLKTILDPNKQLILVTGHRRENHGQGFISICEGLKAIALAHPTAQIIYPVHLNPRVQQPVYELLGDLPNVHLIAPLAYPAFVWLMAQAYLIITDSGGVQEEAPSLGKPVLVMRDTTERPEAVTAGTVILVGTDATKITIEANRLLMDPTHYQTMSGLHNPYGDGTACAQIAAFIKQQMV